QRHCTGFNLVRQLAQSGRGPRFIQVESIFAGSFGALRSVEHRSFLRSLIWPNCFRSSLARNAKQAVFLHELLILLHPSFPTQRGIFRIHPERKGRHPVYSSPARVWKVYVPSSSNPPDEVQERKSTA